MTPNRVFYALTTLWILSEVWIGRRRAADHGKAHDRGTLLMLHAAIYTSIGMGVWLSIRGLGRFPDPLRMQLFWGGSALMVAGMLFRWWAVHVLSRYFTVDVTISPDHKLIRSGPYRMLRHPSYTGALATFYGFALALGSVWSLLLIVVVVTAAFLWRIRVEERALSGAFGPDYAAYARDSKRLLPFVW